MKKLFLSLIVLLVMTLCIADSFAGDISKANVGQIQSASLTTNSQQKETVMLKQYWQIWCYDKNGNLKWYDEFTNLVPTVGLNKYLDCTLKTGCTSPAWYVGLITGPGGGNTYAAADTMASHSGWSENTTYSNATRPTWTPGTISNGSVDNSASKAQFNINGTATIAGSFMVDNSTKGGTTGTLIGEGNYSGGDKSVGNGDTLNVQVTCSMTSS